MRGLIIPIFIIICHSLSANTNEKEDTTKRQLNEVIVVAQESKGITSSSRIDRAAMQHLQPSCFTDILELLPGNISQDPKMNAANSITLRETGTLSATGSKYDNEHYAITSLGTQFIVDGSPINTEANMQSIVGVDSSDPSAKRASVNSGVDMRTLSTDNIESVEIIRGIPSAEYGNLTSGLVNIKRIKKSTPFTLRFKSDEYSKLFSASKGLGIGGSHTINADISYLDSKTDPRNSLENFKRITALIMPTFRFYNNSTSTNWSIGAEYTGSFDNTKTDPDLNLNKIDQYESKHNRYALTSDLNIAMYNCSWIENVVLNTAASFENDRLTRRKQVAPQRASITPSSFDEGDNNVPFLIGEYIADYMVDGKPFTANVKLKMNGKIPASHLNRYKVGVEWSMAKNYGDGQVYDMSHPLSAGWTTRPRAFKDIPAMHTISFFIEDNISINVGSNLFEAQCGIRGMNMPNLDKKYYLSGHTYLDPRINCVWNFPAIDARKPLRFLIGAGWGMTSRMPTLDYLYPQCHYNDIVQFNYYDPQKPIENSLANVRTYKVDVTNYDLKAATNTKFEIRLGASWGNNRLTVTYFNERMSNGFRYTPVYHSYSYKKYDATLYDPAHPSLDNVPHADARILDGFRIVTNGTRIYKSGIEYTIQTQRFMPLRTSLIINGAWFKSTYSNSQPFYNPVSDVVGNQAVSDMYVGLYDTTDGRVNEQFNTNFLFDTQIPQWKLLFTTNIQCMWFVKTKRLKENGMPSAYISASDGNTHPYNASALPDPLLRYLVKTYNDDSFQTVKIPTAIYINFKASKQIGQWLRISAFANRIIDYLPDYKSNGLTVRRNSDSYFGMEVVITT